MLIKDARSPRGRFEPDVQRTRVSMIRPIYGVMQEGESWTSRRLRATARDFLFPPKPEADANEIERRRRHKNEVEHQRRLDNLEHYRQLDRERHRRFRQRRRIAA